MSADTRRHTASGLPALELVTTLLQRVRLEDPLAGLWEAANFQWWWREPRASDEMVMTFWLDADARPVAAVDLKDWGDALGCEPIVLPSRHAPLFGDLWEAVLLVAATSDRPVEVTIRDGDEALTDRATRSGFTPCDDGSATSWMDSETIPAISHLPDGYRLEDRLTSGHMTHHTASHDGPEVEARLAATSLYRADLDLCVRDAEGEVAAYGLFWLDPVTGVGMVEPMRTEPDHRGHGLARHLLTSGLARMVAAGATRLKVSTGVDNIAAGRLYASAGFRRERTARTWHRLPS